MSHLQPPAPPGYPLNPELYELSEDEIAFFKAQTGIQDNDQLREHILTIQEEAYQVHPYPCIRIFAFIRFYISRHPAYKHALKLGERKDAILLDLGCCMGSDVRRAIADGFPRDKVIVSDLHPEFWSLGHRLFKTTHETFPVPCIAGDIFDPKFFKPSPALTSATSLPTLGTLSSVTSLTPLQHRISVIHIASVFHLFGEQKQRGLAHLLATLLSPSPGSMIFGMHIGTQDTDENMHGGKWKTERGVIMFGHSAMSWKNLWVGQDGIFNPEDACVKVTTKENSKYLQRLGRSTRVLLWSVTRT